MNKLKQVLGSEPSWEEDYWEAFWMGQMIERRTDKSKNTVELPGRCVEEGFLDRGFLSLLSENVRRVLSENVRWCAQAARP